MPEMLTSVGLDIGTTSTQMVVSHIRVENKASGFAVPEMEIVERELVYRSPVYFTPLLDAQRMDAQELRKIVEREYHAAGLRREDVDTGAIIITGETSRKENASAVLEALSDLAGDFVVATAGPDLESVLAAKGAGAEAYSMETGKTVLHMDIGGGTSNLALIQAGKIVATGCLNVGGRLVKLSPPGKITYLSPVLKGIWDGEIGQKLEYRQAEALAEILARALEMAAGLRESDGLLEKLTTREAAAPLPLQGNGEQPVISFSGGVADCIQKEHPWLEYGDLGVLLGQAIRKSRLCRGNYVLGKHTIRATVIGAGCHSAQLSGSTVFCQNVPLPLKNIPVITRAEDRHRFEETPVLALSGIPSPSYPEIRKLAEEIACNAGLEPVYLCIRQDMAQALGQALALRLGRDAQILCLDRVVLPEGSYLDVGVPIGPALPVVVKTLVLGERVL